MIAKFGPDSGAVIIVGAHYDTYANLPGADDNASGVAGLLELAKLLSTATLPTQVHLVAYTLEEPPYFATQHMGSYVHAASLQELDVKLMISLEMIGYFSEEENSQRYPINAMKLLYPSKGNFIAIVDEITGQRGAELKAAINKYTGLPAHSINAPRAMRGIDFSDHRNYWAFGIPAVMVTDTAFYRNDAYHTAEDTHDRLNYELMAEVVYGVFKYLAEFEP